MLQKKSEKWAFEVLGSSGGRDGSRSTMCLYLPEGLLIDAGNVFVLPEEKLLNIEHVIVTHSHLDHFLDIPFLIDFSFSRREHSLNIYALNQTIEALRQYIMNWDVWPEFGSIRLSLTGEFAINYIPIEPYCTINISGYEITPFLSNHTVPTIGVVVRKNGRGMVYTSDTHRNPELWHFVNKSDEIHVVLVDVSFPSYLSYLASASLHNTPSTLMEDLSILENRDVRIYAVHIKPAFEEEVIMELAKLPRKVIPIVGRKTIWV